ncbi:hypothetical protein [Bacillus cereus]|uniref:hypothetical protein n=1 Tax=Bacillus cereus TaxID=1396 RepID=UPI003CFED459
MGAQDPALLLTPNQKEILNLERKYFYILHNTFTSPEFINDLKAIESSIKANYSSISLLSQKKNKIDTALEGLMRFYMYKTIKSESVYHSSFSSDLAFFTNDALINIDAKTIDKESNKQDEDKVIVEKNQISFMNDPMYEVSPFYLGLRYKPRLPTRERNLPTLTYFIKCIYQDDFTNFDLIGISLACVPNGELRNLFDNKIISGFKDYEYVTSSMASNPRYTAYTPVNAISPSWRRFKLYSRSRGDCYYDSTLTNPLYPTDNVFWKKIKGEYQVCIDGSTARIDAETLKFRYDAYKNPWTGNIYIDL